MINFDKTTKHARILNPLKGFKEDTITFEYRTDPLTGRNTTVIKGMLNYISKFLVSDEELLNSLVEQTRVNCPFCARASGPMNKHPDYFDVNLRVMSRPGIQALSFTDAWALPYLLWDGEAAEAPELLAERAFQFGTFQHSHNVKTLFVIIPK